MHVFRVFAWLTILLVCCSPTSYAQPQRLQATLQRSGTIQLRDAQTQQTFATLRAGVFLAPWQFFTTSAGRQPSTALIKVLPANATIAVTFDVRLETNSDHSLLVKYTLTPDKPLRVNSAHVALLTPTREWIRAKATLGSDEVIIGETADKANLLSGTGALTLTRRGTTIALESAQAPLLLQDNRPFNASELELRAGTAPADNEGRVWPAGATETVEVVVRFPAPVKLIKEEPITLNAGDDWLPLDEPTEIVPNSALDFGVLNEAPAGKFGRVIAAGGHFGFEARPGRTERFYGVNLCFSANFPEKPDADKLADRLARLGYNTVRIHHYDGGLSDADNQDRLDYLLAALKKRGIYWKTDLYVSRTVADSISLGDFKAAVLVSDTAFADWEAFTRQFLSHVNPYTGLAYKDDPALAFLGVVNEPNLTNGLARFSPALRTLFEKDWAIWRQSLKLPAAPLPRELTNDRLGRELGAFLAHLHERGFARMKTVIRSTGCKALLTDLNGWSEFPALMAARTRLDFVDTHFYWDHPRFLEQDWQLPSQGYQDGRSAVGDAGAGPDAVAMTRLFGKPFTISEYNYTAPNEFRAEGGLLMGATAALQDWDAIWRFAWAHSREAATQPQPLGYFDLASDPLSLASERAAVLLFRRGDLTPAPNALSRVLKRDDLLERYDIPALAGFKELALLTRIGTWIEEDKEPLAPARPTELRLSRGTSAEAISTLLRTNRLTERNRTNLANGDRQSETDTVFINSLAGTLRVITPRTIGAVVGPNDAVRCGPLQITVGDTTTTVWVSSLDGKPVTRSNRLLLVHLTDLQNTGTRYGGPDRRVLEAWGSLPHLVRRGTATLTLTRETKGKAQAWRLDTTGNRVAPLALTVQGNQVTAPLATAAEDGKATIYYELTIQQEPTPPKVAPKQPAAPPKKPAKVGKG